MSRFISVLFLMISLPAWAGGVKALIYEGRTQLGFEIKLETWGKTGDPIRIKRPANLTLSKHKRYFFVRVGGTGSGLDGAVDFYSVWNRDMPVGVTMIDRQNLDAKYHPRQFQTNNYELKRCLGVYSRLTSLQLFSRVFSCLAYDNPNSLNPPPKMPTQAEAVILYSPLNDENYPTSTYVDFSDFNVVER